MNRRVKFLFQWNTKFFRLGLDRWFDNGFELGFVVWKTKKFFSFDIYFFNLKLWFCSL